MYTNILLATDGSEHSRRAAANAIFIASNNKNSKVEIVYVISPNKAKSNNLHNWNTEEIFEKNKQKLLEVERLAKESGVEYEITILHGEPDQIIVNYINNKKFDVAVLGSRGLSLMQEFVLGSVSHKVAKRAKCPVLIVK